MLLQYMQQQSDLSGNRTRVSAVRGRRLNRLTNGPEMVTHPRLELSGNRTRVSAVRGRCLNRLTNRP